MVCDQQSGEIIPLNSYLQRRKGKSLKSKSSGFGFGKSKPSGGKGGGGPMSGCFRCGEAGHMARDCTKPGKGSGGGPPPPTFATQEQPAGQPVFMQPQQPFVAEFHHLQTFDQNAFVEEGMSDDEEQPCFGVYPADTTLEVYTANSDDGGPLKDLLGGITPSVLQTESHPMFAGGDEAGSSSGTDILATRDPWQAKANAARVPPIRKGFAEPVNQTWSAFTGGAQPLPERGAEHLYGPAAPGVRELEASAKQDASMVFGRGPQPQGGPAQFPTQEEHTSAWAQQCLKPGDPPKYDPEQGNQSNRQDAALEQILREQRHYSRQPGPRTESAFAQNFREREPYKLPEKGYLTRPVLPYQVDAGRYLNPGELDEKEGAPPPPGPEQRASVWATGVDTHASGLNFYTEVKDYYMRCLWHEHPIHGLPHMSQTIL
jgi:hypothetical protein